MRKLANRIGYHPAMLLAAACLVLTSDHTASEAAVVDVEATPVEIVPSEGENPLRPGFLDRFSGSYRESVYLANVSGPRNRSFRIDGTTFQEMTLGLQAGKRVFRGLDWDISLGLRRTTDLTVATYSDFKIRNYRSVLQNRGKWELATGDVVAHLTPYTMQRGFTGSTYFHDLAAFGGTLRPTIGFGYGFRDRESVTYRRDLVGIGLEWSGPVNLWWGDYPKTFMIRGAYADAEDDSSSIRSTFVGQQRFKSNALALQTELQLTRNFTLGNEWARSDGSSNAHSQQDLDDNAFNIELKFLKNFPVFKNAESDRWTPTRAGLRHEVVGPRFLSPWGFAATNRRRTNAYGVWALPSDFRLTVDWSNTSNNIDQVAAFTNTSTVWDAMLGWLPFARSQNFLHDGWRNIDISFTYSGFSNVLMSSGNKSTVGDVVNDDYLIRLQDRWGNFSMSFDQLFRELSDRFNRVNDRSAWSSDIRMAWDFELEQSLIKLTPTLRYRYLNDESPAAPQTGATDVVSNLTEVGLDFRRKTLAVKSSYAYDNVDRAAGQRDNRTETFKFNLSYSHPRWRNTSINLNYSDQEIHEENPRLNYGTEEGKMDLIFVF